LSYSTFIFSDNHEDNKLKGKEQENIQSQNSPPLEGWRKFGRIFDGVVMNHLFFTLIIALCFWRRQSRRQKHKKAPKKESHRLDNGNL